MAAQQIAKLTSELETLHLDEKTISRIAYKSEIDLLAEIQDLEDEEKHLPYRVFQHHSTFNQADEKHKSKSPARPGFPNVTSKYSVEVAAGFSPHSCHTKNCVGLDCKPIQSKRKGDLRGEGQQVIARLTGIQKRITNLESLLSEKNSDLLSLQLKARSLDQAFDSKANLCSDLE
jgi:hypothetical protein